MRKFIFCVFVLFLSFPVWAAAPQTDEQKTLYALGAGVGKQLAVLNLSAEEYEFVKQGMNDAALGQKLTVDPDAFAKQISELAQKRIQAGVEKEKVLSKAYLDKAATEPGVKKTAMGVIYTEIKAGTGAQAKVEDTVKVHYVGTLINGKEFDSSIKRGEPAEFPLGQVIPCWTEGVAMMKVGGKARLVCPPDMAYGDRGFTPVIPGGAALIFEVELLEVKPPVAASDPEPAVKPAAEPVAKPAAKPAVKATKPAAKKK